VNVVKKAIYYINQFFGQIGGEDKADFSPEIREGVVGPGMPLSQALAPEVEVTHTVICGDNYFGSNEQDAIEQILGFLEGKQFDFFIAGPAFMAGRYGVACGSICKAVTEKFGVPAITSMYEENPAVEMYRKDIYIFSGGNSAAVMRKDLGTMVNFIKKLATGEKLGPAKEEGYFPRGIRHQALTEPRVSAAQRAVEMLLKKLNGEIYETESPMPKIDRIPIAPSVENLSEATVAVVTSGGIVPVGNPDRIQSASATKWGKYNISGMEALKAGDYMTIHAGFDPTAANNNPNVIFPLDVLREYEKEGRIGKLYDYFYSTVGTGTSQVEATRMGEEIAQELRDANVNAVILVST
jgi:glycine/betaine/sarcosine/D-proline reductase family selenoprotein B